MWLVILVRELRPPGRTWPELTFALTVPTSVCDSVAPSRSTGGLRGPWSPDARVVDVPPSSKGGKFEPY